MFLQDPLTSVNSQERRKASINIRAISEPKRSAQPWLEQTRFGSDIERLLVEGLGSMLSTTLVLAHQHTTRCAFSNSRGNGPVRHKVLASLRGQRAVPLAS